MAPPTADRIAETLFGKTRRRTLGLLFGRPDESFYLRQIVRTVDAGVGSVQRELAGLTVAGLVTRTRRGKQVFFQANASCPVFEELRRLVEKTTALADKVRAALIPFEESGRIAFAFIYGSVATGEHSPESDVDVLILGDVRLAEIIPALRSLQDQVGREINPSIYGLDEFIAKGAAGEHFVKSVMTRPKIMLVGSEHDLEELAS
jgi:predicted nucleotidyltransferase